MKISKLETYVGNRGDVKTKRRSETSGTQLQVLTANVTSHGSLRKLLDWIAEHHPNISAACIQEAKVLPQDIAEWSKRLFNMGWKSFWEPALSTKLGGVSAGVVTNYCAKAPGLWQLKLEHVPRSSTQWEDWWLFHKRQ